MKELIYIVITVPELTVFIILVEAVLIKVMPVVFSFAPSTNVVVSILVLIDTLLLSGRVPIAIWLLVGLLVTGINLY